VNAPVVAVAGEALVDLIAEGDVLRPLPGGGPFNTAVALGRLEVPVRYVGCISDDAFGSLLAERLVASGVDTRYLLRSSVPTPLAIVHQGEDGDHDFSFHLDGTAYADIAPSDLPAFDDDVAALHVGTLALATDPPATAYEALIEREHVSRLVVVDPNVRPAVCGERATYLRRFEAWAEKAHVLKLSDDDAAWLYPDVDEDTAIASLLERGVRLVVLTRGARGALARTSSARARVPAVEVEAVDTVGAGDAFGAGFLRGLWESGALDAVAVGELDEHELGKALSLGATVAALQCMRAGADAPTLAEVQEFHATAGCSG
jgi:fructokinase